MLGMDHFELMGSPWGDLELVSLNSDLGEYFGAKDGVLVVKAPADSSLPLKGGDVITSIGGGRAARPPRAARGLGAAPEGRRRDHVHRRAEARQPVARDADPAVVRDGRNGVDRDPEEAEAHQPGLEGARPRRPLLPYAPRARRARGPERAAAPPAQAPGAPAARLRKHSQ